MNESDDNTSIMYCVDVCGSYYFRTFTMYELNELTECITNNRVISIRKSYHTQNDSGPYIVLYDYNKPRTSKEYIERYEKMYHIPPIPLTDFDKEMIRRLNDGG